MDPTNLESKVVQEEYNIEQIIDLPFLVRKIITRNNDLIILTQRDVMVYWKEKRGANTKYRFEEKLKMEKGNWNDIQISDNKLFISGWRGNLTNGNILIYGDNGLKYQLIQSLRVNGEILKTQPTDSLLFTLVRDNEGRSHIKVYSEENKGRYKEKKDLPQRIKYLLSDIEIKDFFILKENLFVVGENKEYSWSTIKVINLEKPDDHEELKYNGKLNKVFVMKREWFEVLYTIPTSGDKEKKVIVDILKDQPKELIFLSGEKGAKTFLTVLGRKYKPLEKMLVSYDSVDNIYLKICLGDNYKHKVGDYEFIGEIGVNNKIRTISVSDVNNDLLIMEQSGLINIYSILERGNFMTYNEAELSQYINPRKLMKYFNEIDNILPMTAQFSGDELFIGGAKILPQTKESKLRKALNEMFELDGGLKKVKAEGFVVVYRRKENGREE